MPKRQTKSNLQWALGELISNETFRNFVSKVDSFLSQDVRLFIPSEVGVAFYYIRDEILRSLDSFFRGEQGV